jgi:hypothetical protein
MSSPVIQIVDLGKAYRLGQEDVQHATLREALVNGDVNDLAWRTPPVASFGSSTVDDRKHACMFSSHGDIPSAQCPTTPRVYADR